ncbi:protein mono-ADP-ribosyltransferase PARP9 [Pelodytes ibericus]
MYPEFKVKLSEGTYRSLYASKHELSKLIFDKFACVLELKGPAPSVTHAKPPVLFYEKRLGEVKISVWKDDMTRQDADAVVNAANESLAHAGGIALALANAGGAQVLQESNSYISQHGPVKTGGVAVTSGGKLPCKKIIHAVGPMWAEWKHESCESELEEAIKNVLIEAAKDPGIRSVAIPAVSSGIFGFPLDRCASIIVKTVCVFCQNLKSDHLREVRFVNHDDRTVYAMQRACIHLLEERDHSIRFSTASQRTPSTYHEPASSYHGSPSTHHGSPSTHHGSPSTHHGSPSTHHGSPSTHHGSPYSHHGSPYTHHGPPPMYHTLPFTSSISLNGVNLYLTTGCIENQRTNVIVNSVCRELNLSNGKISSAILRKAGYTMQEEMNAKRNIEKVREGKLVIPTMGYNLPCKSVFHVILPPYNHSNSEQVLRQVMDSCLDLTRFYNHSSISFPSLGTGVLSFPKQRVAEIMIQSVIHFAMEVGRSLDINFVIHPSDWDIFRMFENEFKSLEANLRWNSPTHAPAERGSGFAAEETCLLINGPNEDAIRDTSAWLQDTLLAPGTVRIENSHILLFGKEEHDALSKFPDVEITEDLHHGKSALNISGDLKEVIRAAVWVEQRLLSIQAEYAQEMEVALVQAMVQWFYVHGDNAVPYPATANAEIEKVYISNSDSELQITEPCHQINVKTATAKDPTNAFRLHRECALKHDYATRINLESGAVLIMPVDSFSQEYRDRVKEFEKEKLTIVKMEKIQNKVLAGVYQSKKDAMDSNQGKSSFHKLYQRVPAECRTLVCKVGFDRLYSPSGVSNPDIIAPVSDSEFGAGIYFKKTLKAAMEGNTETRNPDSLIYIFQAEVATGKFTKGKTSYILPPPVGADDDLKLYDSTVDSNSDPQTFVIFDNHRALPQYLFTCRRNKHLGSNV